MKEYSIDKKGGSWGSDEEKSVGGKVDKKKKKKKKKKNRMDCEEAGGVTKGVGVDEHYKNKRVRSEEE